MDFIYWLGAIDSLGFLIIRSLMSTLWQSSILFIVFGILAYMLRRRKETVRHALLVVVILIIPFLPLISWMLKTAGTPQKEVPILPLYSAPEVIDQSHYYVKPSQRSYQPEQQQQFVPDAPSESIPSKEQNREIRVSIQNYPWAVALFVYAGGVLFFLLSVLSGRFRIKQWIINGDAVIDTRIIELFENVRKRLGLRRDITIIESKEASVPFTFQTFRPVVLLPVGFAENLTEPELETVAVHELAHVKRSDSLILTMVSLVKAFFFFHPLIWLAIREVSYLAESICDRAVMEVAGEPESYAQLISRLAENLPRRAMSTEYAVGIIFSKGIFLRRIEAILSHRSDEIRKLSRLVLIGTIAVAVMSLIAVLAFPLGENKEINGDKTLVSGIVLHDNEHVSSANVYLNIPENTFPRFDVQSQPMHVAKTKRDGSFSFKMYENTLNNQLILPNISVYHPQHAVGGITLSRDMDITNITIRLGTASLVEGNVFDGKGKPVKGATVTTRSMRYGETGRDYNTKTIPGLKSITDRNGSFILTNIPVGANLTLEISCKGYARVLYPKELLKRVFAGSKNVNIILEQEGRIEGKVTYHDTGKPAENIKLFAASLDLRISNSDIIKSDRNGRYMITNLESGIYHVTIVQEEMFPDLTAIPVEHVAVEPGNTVQNIDLQLIKGGIITGRIYDTDTREPLPGIRVTAQTAEMNSRLTFGKALTDEKGEYRIRSAPGIVKVYPHSPFGYEYANIKADIEVIEGKTLDDVDFHFKKGLVLTGMVLSSEGNPLQGVVVSSRPFSDWRGTVISGDEGNFTLTGLKDGGMLLIDAEHKEQRLRSKADFKIHAGTEIEIHLEPYETATIEGRVVDEHDKPLSNVNIKLSKSEEDPRPASGVLSISSVIVAITDDSGNYRVDNLIPGIDRHYLSAEADGYKYESIFFLRDLKSGLQHLDDTVLEKETAERWLEGIVADSYGNPVTGARINIQGYYPLKQTYTDASGYYRFDSLKRIVERNFALDHSNYGHYRFENVATNAIRNITLVKPEYHLSGRVVDTDGEPAMGTRVSIEPQMRDSGFVYIGKQTDIDGRFCFDNMIDNRVTLSFYHHEKSLSKRLENVETNRDDLTFILEKFDRSRTDFPVWEFDQRRITILEDGNSPELNCSQWIQGEPVKIKNLLGNVVVLDFWTSGYSKSVEGLEIMKALTKEYSEKGLIIIGIHEYTKDITLLKKLLADKEISYTVAVDKQSIIEDSMGETFELYGLTRKKFPNIIIDRDGSIIRDVYERSLLVQIEMLFNNKTSSSPLPKQATGTGKTMSDDNIWHFGWNEGMAKAQREKKPVIVQFDMKKDGIWRNAINDSLYQTPDIRKRLESEWICILLDVAEQRKTATYQGRTFSYRDLLRFFRSDTSATHVFFNKTGEPVQSVLSYVLRGNKEHIDLILDYMRDELYEKDITFHEYLKEFKPL